MQKGQCEKHSPRMLVGLCSLLLQTGRVGVEKFVDVLSRTRVEQIHANSQAHITYTSSNSHLPLCVPARTSAHTYTRVLSEQGVSPLLPSERQAAHVTDPAKSAGLVALALSELTVHQKRKAVSKGLLCSPRRHFKLTCS